VSVTARRFKRSVVVLICASNTSFDSSSISVLGALVMVRFEGLVGLIIAVVLIVLVVVAIEVFGVVVVVDV